MKGSLHLLCSFNLIINQVFPSFHSRNISVCCDGKLSVFIHIPSLSVLSFFRSFSPCHGSVKTGTLWPMQRRSHGCWTPPLRKTSRLEVLSISKGEVKRSQNITVENANNFFVSNFTNYNNFCHLYLTITLFFHN